MQNSFQMVSSAVSDRGLSDKRPQNEDSYLEMPERGLFAVADGVGGAQAGDIASQMAVEQLGEAFTNFREGDVEELMHEAISLGNSAIYQMSHELPQLSTMATTIVALQISGNVATIGHAGDSRLYRLDSAGNLYRETQDHSIVEEEVRAGRMTPEQAENHPSKNVISRALGAESTVEVDMKTIMFEPNTTFLLCSDGITRHISDVEIRDLLALQHPPVTICGEMKQICYERGAEDNLTAVIVRVSGSPVAQIEEESTIATARPAFADSAIFASSMPDEIPTQRLEMPMKTADFTTNGMQISASENDPNAIKVERDELTYTIGESKVGSGLGSLLPFLLGLVIGGIIGAGIYFAAQSFMSSPEPPASEITKTQTEYVSYKTFEDSRRRVDEDPNKFITAQGTEIPTNADDLYLLGRAHMLQGHMTTAKDLLGKAKAALKDYVGENKATLINEIAIASAVVKNEEALKFVVEEKDGKNANAGVK